MSVPVNIVSPAQTKCSVISWWMNGWIDQCMMMSDRIDGWKKLMNIDWMLSWTDVSKTGWDSWRKRNSVYSKVEPKIMLSKWEEYAEICITARYLISEKWSTLILILCTGKKFLKSFCVCGYVCQIYHIKIRTEKFLKYLLIYLN